MFPRQRIHTEQYTNGVLYVVCAEMLYVGEYGAISQSVKRRLRIWCEKAASLGVSQMKQ
jgi:hypothetical protein